ncbi:hydratase [Clostridium akagii]|uniref:hydratase n=1 Tax=Clostridium akagii TaxID=91623 RepID=UPI00047AF0B9|nr:hydratase [Clostridium akagii]
MVEIINKGAYLYKNQGILGYEDNLVIDDITSFLKEKGEVTPNLNKILNKDYARKNTISYDILTRHNTTDNTEKLRIKFDALASHDITYVAITQTAKASGLKEFPIPYVLTNCHNSLCAVGGTINEDDHVFGLSAAKKYGGIYVPPHEAVIHQYMREMMSQCGNMILGSDSHTRYGALGTMAIGEGGPELVKQLLSKTYDVDYPEVIAIYLEGETKAGVGPQDVALSIIGTVFKNGFVKNKIMEFVGPGIKNLSADFRIGIDVMTTETTCLSSIWCTDDKIEEYYSIHGRHEAYSKLEPTNVAYYDGLVKVDLTKIEPMIALPFHPSNVFSIADLNKNPKEILQMVEEAERAKIDNPNVQFNLTNKIVDGKIRVDQGIIAGCAGGTFENLRIASEIISDHSLGNDYFNLSVYPASQPIYLELIKDGAIAKFIQAGAVIKTAFCGPCFGAGDVPANGALSIRHTTRNFPSREGSKPGLGQISSVALMDAKSIAATAINGGILTPATEISIPSVDLSYHFDSSIYNNRIYNGYKKPENSSELKYGPNITSWPEMLPLQDKILLKMCCVITDPVTTTDELMPSGETSSYRSNPLKLAEYTLSRKDPHYVERTKAVQVIEKNRQAFLHGDAAADISELKTICSKITNVEITEETLTSISKKIQFGSVIFAVKPGDGSAREQAASSQKVLGGLANIAEEYATKRYRSNLINWGMIPFTINAQDKITFEVGDYIYIEGIIDAIKTSKSEIPALLIGKSTKKDIKLKIGELTEDEKSIILAGSLINFYASTK